jgi:hypothetical protein
MQAIEIEADITPDGNIHLPAPLRSVYGRHARLILLFDEASGRSDSSAIDKLRSLQGAFRNDPEFDAAVLEMDRAWQAWQS